MAAHFAAISFFLFRNLFFPLQTQIFKFSTWMRKVPFFFLLTIYLIFSHINGCAQIVAHFSFDNASGESSISESISSNLYQVENYQKRPERIDGIEGHALRLDGYSTWVTLPNFSIPNISDKMTVAFWYATESFNAEIAGLVHQKADGQGFSISINPYGKLVMEFYAQGKYYSMTTSQSIQKYKWNHIVFQIDLPNSKAYVYVNNKLWGEKETDLHTQIDLNDNLSYIGRSPSNSNFAGFPLAVANGAIDELTFYNTIIPTSTIQEIYDQYKTKEVNLTIDHNIRHPDDYLRPRFHPMPNTSWTNEPYGFTYYNDKYHLFFQKNPNAPTLHFMHWGHLSSPDLVNWKEENIVLAPEEGFASKGAWSGTTFFDHDDHPVIAYTGVNGIIAGIGLASPTDTSLNAWLPHDDNPIIPSAPSDINHLDFRDPYVWLEDETYYMIVGSGLRNNGGGILMTYTSDDLTDWVNIPSIYSNSDAAKAGTFWEMPFFNKINDEDYLLVVTPQFRSKPAETIYWVGSFDGRHFTPYDEAPKRFEHLSRHLLSPAIGLDKENQLAYSGIIPEDRDPALQIKAGWRHIFSIPRSLRLLDDKKTIGHIPHPNICRARDNEVLVEDRSISAGTSFNLPEYRGSQSELYFKLYTSGVDEFKIQVFKNEAGTQLTSITFDKSDESLGINRVLSSTAQTVENIRKESYTFSPDDTIDVRVFLDHSVIEVFVDNTVVMSARVYPSLGSELIDIVTESETPVEVLEFRAWDIDSKEVENEPDFCPTPSLPTGLFTTSIFEDGYENYLQVYPNPSTDLIFLDQLRPNSEIYIFDLGGHIYQLKTDGRHIDISSLTRGLYIGKLKNGNSVYSFKFIKT